MDKKEIRKQSDKKRERILKRDKKCVICGNSSHLEVHHILAIYLGGDESEENLITLCKVCHKLAPETGKEDFISYMMNPYKDVMDRMLSSKEVNEMLNNAFITYHEEVTEEYLNEGLITKEQREKILLYELSKSGGFL